MAKTTEKIKYIIAIASGKGGVGKSTTTANLAFALTQLGERVGILDADIYGPNQPQLLGVQTQKPESPDGKTLQPVIAHGVQSMSIGYLIEIDTPMVWRGPMATGALLQLMNDTNWDNLDYLLIDLPPGTGDIQLTLTQKFPLSAAVIVTTPQDIALLDVRKAMGMFKKVNVPVLGVVENMGLHHCPACGHEENIFGEGGAATLVKEYDTTLLGTLPLDRRIREQSDQGNPIVLAEPLSHIAKRYVEIAKQVKNKLAELAKKKGKFPRIRVENK